MKKNLLTCFFIFNAVLISFGKPPASDSIVKPINNYSSYELFVNFGYVNPMGIFGKAYDFNPYESLEVSIPNSMNGTIGGFGAQSGYTEEIGGIFYFDQNQKKTMIGLRTIFFSFASFPFRWKTDSDYVFNNATYTSVNLISFRLGPCVRTTFNKFTLEAFYQIGPVFSSHGGWSFEEHYDALYNGFHYNVDDKGYFLMHKGTGFRHEIGFAASYKWIKTGCSLNIMSIKYNGLEFYRHVNIPGVIGIGETFSGKGSTNFFNIFIGFRIGK